jgi:hypothetical protein
MKKFLFALSTGLLLACGSAEFSHAQTVRTEAANHPRIAAAIRELEGAITYMERAPHDFGGHKAAAIRDSRAALAELRGVGISGSKGSITAPLTTQRAPGVSHSRDSSAALCFGRRASRLGGLADLYRACWIDSRWDLSPSSQTSLLASEVRPPWLQILRCLGPPRRAFYSANTKADVERKALLGLYRMRALAVRTPGCAPSRGISWPSERGIAGFLARLRSLSATPEALGFIRVTERGPGGNAEQGIPISENSRLLKELLTLLEILFRLEIETHIAEKLMNAPTFSADDERSLPVESKRTRVETDVERIKYSVARSASNSIDGLLELTSELQELQKFLNSQVQQVQGAIENASAGIKIIVETIAPLKGSPISLATPTSARQTAQSRW